jgi:thiol:disulfide interchange protein
MIRPFPIAWWVPVVFSLLLSMTLVPPAGAQDDPWLTSLEDALKKGQEQNKLVLADFTAEWCKWCVRLKTEVFDQREFLEFAAAKLILVVIDADRNRELVDKHGVKGFPTILIFSPDGKKKEEIEGFRSLPEFLKLLKGLDESRTAPAPAPK